MINFIVCDSNKVVVAEVKRLIEQKMMRNDICYQIHTFYKYDDEFNLIINKPMSNKIYILDIETLIFLELMLQKQLEIMIIKVLLYF